MNYPYDQHNTSSQNSKNQFMLSESSMINSSMMNSNANGGNNDMQKIFSYMKNVMSNPMLMDQMEKFLAVKQTQKNSSFILKQNQSLSVTRMDAQIRQPPNSYVIESSLQQRPEPLRMNANQNVKKIKSPQINQNNAHMNKRHEGLMAYINNEANMQSQFTERVNNDYEMSNRISERIIKPQERQIKNEQRSIPQQPKQPVSFDDIPIKSTYTENKQFNNFDSALAYPQNQSQFYESNHSKKNTTNKTLTSTKTNSNNNLQKFLEAQQRPINGTRKDFKQLLKEQFGQTPFDEKPIPTLSGNTSNKWAQIDEYGNENQNDQGEDQQDNKPKKQFLKRGSRQYLSSAKDKKSVAKKSVQQTKNKDSQQNLNSSRLGPERTERDKTPTKRDVSQNRILSKRNTTGNDKSVSKLKTQNNINNSSYYQSKQQEEPKKNIMAKNEVPKSKSPILPPKNNKQSNNLGKSTVQSTVNAGSGKKKNVFDDSSSEDQGKQHSWGDQDDEQNPRGNNLINVQRQNKDDERKFSSYQPDKEFNMFSREKKQQVIDGVYLSKSQLNTILQRYAPKVQSSNKNINSSEEKFNQLRKKYTDLCNLLEKQKIQHEEQMQKERQEFQTYKQQEMQKIKNQRRVMERQVKSSMPSQSQNLQKDKEEVQNLKKQLQKEREDHKKKQKNNKILIEKYKKQNQELKLRLQKVEDDLEKQSQNSVQNNFSSTHSQRQSSHNLNNARPSTSNNDKSKSKLQTKDVSPAKAKMSKSSKVFQQNQEDNDQDKNYKKTVPLYKQTQHQKKALLPSPNQNSKKAPINASKHISENNNSDDDNLPTFKVDDKKNNDSSKVIKSQKKYQFIENSVEQPQSKKQNQSAPNKSNSTHLCKGSSKNVFADDSDQQNDHGELQANDDSQNEAGHQSGFFKPQSKYEKLSDLMSSNFSIKEVTSQMIENLFRYEQNAEYCKYMQRINNPKRMIVNSSKNGVDKKITNIYNDKSKQILFQNGVKKQIFEDGYTIIYFKNGDIKQKLQDGTTLYYFNDKKVDQITLVNGLNIYRFDNNQVEIHYDGNKYIEIRHPDGTIKMLGSPIH